MITQNEFQSSLGLVENKNIKKPTVINVREVYGKSVISRVSTRRNDDDEGDAVPC